MLASRRATGDRLQTTFANGIRSFNPLREPEYRQYRKKESGNHERFLCVTAPRPARMTRRSVPSAIVCRPAYSDF